MDWVLSLFLDRNLHNTEQSQCNNQTFRYLQLRHHTTRAAEETVWLKCRILTRILYLKLRPLCWILRLRYGVLWSSNKSLFSSFVWRRQICWNSVKEHGLKSADISKPMGNLELKLLWQPQLFNYLERRVLHVLFWYKFDNWIIKFTVY